MARTCPTFSASFCSALVTSWSANAVLRVALSVRSAAMPRTSSFRLTSPTLSLCVSPLLLLVEVAHLVKVIKSEHFWGSTNPHAVIPHTTTKNTGKKYENSTQGQRSRSSVTDVYSLLLFTITRIHDKLHHLLIGSFQVFALTNTHQQIDGPDWNTVLCSWLAGNEQLEIAHHIMESNPNYPTWMYLRSHFKWFCIWLGFCLEGSDISSCVLAIVWARWHKMRLYLALVSLFRSKSFSFRGIK